MNLRQKAKKLKRENDCLRNMAIATKGIHIPSVQKSIVTLSASQVVCPEDYLKWSDKVECNAKETNKLLAAKLLHEILKYTEITRCYWGDGLEMVTARIDVVDMNKY